MTVKREFTVAQALSLINKSEGNIVRDNKKRASDHNEPGAHSLGRHLVSAGTIGGKASGPQAGADFVKNRFVSSPDLTSSAWYKKGDMALRLAEALNSSLGQKALSSMEDLSLSRVVIHYINQNNMTKRDSDLFNPKHMSVGYTVTPDKTVTTPKDIYNSKDKTKPPIFIKTIQQKSTVKGSTNANVSSEDVMGIHFVLDRYSAGSIHLQTLYPSFEQSKNNFEYRVGEVSWTVTQSGNSFTKKFSAG